MPGDAAAVADGESERNASLSQVTVVVNDELDSASIKRQHFTTESTSTVGTS
jgi:hypothetical protein